MSAAKGRATVSAVPLAPSQRRLPPLLRRAWYSLNQTFRRRIAHTGITPDQFTILRWLTEGDPKGLTQRELADLMASDPNTIAALLKRMEAGGLIERRPHEQDQRAHRVRLAMPGKRLYGHLRKIAVEVQSEALAAVPIRERAEFLQHLEAVADACSAALKKGEPGR
jgi:DNA-binding MarR family transcriptional regulator